MPSRFLLSYAVTNILINEIRDAFQKDKELWKTEGSDRINTPKVLDGWNYTIREYPSIIVTSTPGTSRRMGIGDAAPVPYFGVSAEEDQSVATDIYRKFWVSMVLPVGMNVEVTFGGDPATTPAQWNVPVIEEEVSPGVYKRYVVITGTAVGPNSTYSRENFKFISRTPTAAQYGGFFDIRPEIYTVTLSQPDREIITDKLWSFLWFTKKRELLYKGVVILDVSFSGVTQQDYGADKIYLAKMSVNCATEFRQLVYYLDTVEGIKVEGTAMVPATL